MPVPLIPEGRHGVTQVVRAQAVAVDLVVQRRQRGDAGRGGGLSQEAFDLGLGGVHLDEGHRRVVSQIGQDAPSGGGWVHGDQAQSGARGVGGQCVGGVARALRGHQPVAAARGAGDGHAGDPVLEGAGGGEGGEVQHVDADAALRRETQDAGAFPLRDRGQGPAGEVGQMGGVASHDAGVLAVDLHDVSWAISPAPMRLSRVSLGTPTMVRARASR
jgi:hypothetical protein